MAEPSPDYKKLFYEEQRRREAAERAQEEAEQAQEKAEEKPAGRLSPSSSMHFTITFIQVSPLRPMRRCRREATLRMRITSFGLKGSAYGKISQHNRQRSGTVLWNPISP
jgi:hypothetical protein